MTVSQRKSEANAEPDPYLRDIVFVDQLPSDAWAEGLAIRPNGDVLVSRVDQPELFTIELASAKLNEDNEFDVLRPRTIHTFDNANSVFDVCSLDSTGTREEYAVLSGYADFSKPGNDAFHTFVVSRVTLTSGSSDEPPQVTKIADLPDAGVPVGLEPVSNTTILVADAGKSCIWKVSMSTGEVSVLLEDPTMQPHEGEAFGVNRIKVRAEYLWYTNTCKGTLSRVPISGKDDIQAIGPVEHVADGLSNAADGLVMFDDARIAYVVSYALGVLWRIDIDESGKGTVNVLREDLLSPTAMRLVYAEEGAKPALHILCCGAVQEAWLDTSKGAWFDMANVTDKMHITVTVTTEVTYVSLHGRPPPLVSSYHC